MPSSLSLAYLKLTKMSNMKRISTVQSTTLSVKVLSSTKQVLYGIRVAVYISKIAIIIVQIDVNFDLAGMIRKGIFYFFVLSLILKLLPRR